MRKNSKPPEERRRELVAVASRLFQEKGYEAVSVRDILDAVHGAPGMFYYYFKSKQDIYLATIEQYLSERIERRCQVLEDANVSFDEKQTAFHQLLQEDIAGYMQRFQQGRDRSITDDSYKLWDFMQLLNHLIQPYAGFIRQGLREGRIDPSHGITHENAEAYATFFLYGAWGMIYNQTFTEGDTRFDLDDVYKVVGSFIRNPQ